MITAGVMSKLHIGVLVKDERVVFNQTIHLRCGGVGRLCKGGGGLYMIRVSRVPREVLVKDAFKQTIASSVPTLPSHICVPAAYSCRGVGRVQPSERPSPSGDPLGVVAL